MGEMPMSAFKPVRHYMALTESLKVSCQRMVKMFWFECFLFSKFYKENEEYLSFPYLHSYKTRTSIFYNHIYAPHALLRFIVCGTLAIIHCRNKVIGEIYHVQNIK